MYDDSKEGIASLSIWSPNAHDSKPVPKKTRISRSKSLLASYWIASGITMRSSCWW